MVKTSVNRMFFTGDGSVEFFVNLPTPCINAAITDRFVMLFGDMADQESMNSITGSVSST